MQRLNYYRIKVLHNSCEELHHSHIVYGGDF
jgi:hypothetical protein